MNRFTSALIGFAVGWLVCNLEYAFAGTAWGGPFTILMIPVVAGFISGSLSRSRAEVSGHREAPRCLAPQARLGS
jgi:hypothetical protein